MVSRVLQPRLGPVLHRGDSVKVGGRRECCVGCRENWAPFFNGATVLRVRLLRGVCGAPRHAHPRRWQSVGLFAWMACPCHFRCVPPRYGSCSCVLPHRLASGPLSCVLQSVHGPAQTRALVRLRLGERRGWPAIQLSGFALPRSLLTSAAECTCSFPVRTR